MVYCICGEYLGYNEETYHSNCLKIIDHLKKNGNKKILRIIEDGLKKESKDKNN